jgi:GT2 family glycosyltransferase
MTSDQSLPFVSVVVPVYNDARRIVGCVQALLSQTYPRERYEVIVVDNGSTDGSYEAVRPFPVTLLRETGTQGSFAARNTGLRQARGEIYAFTDSDCTPAPQWLAEGVHAIQAGADLVGGNVRFVFSTRPSGAEVQDAIANLRVERYIREEGAAVTANLFVRAPVFAAVGPFANNFTSGGDKLFTQSATRAGYSLVYSARAEVAHPTRRLTALLKKQYRVGRGHHALRKASRSAAQQSTPAHHRRPKLLKFLRVLKGFLPERISLVAQSMRNRDIPVEPLLLMRVWGVAWLCRAATTLGNLSAARAGLLSRYRRATQRRLVAK